MRVPCSPCRAGAAHAVEPRPVHRLPRKACAVLVRLPPDRAQASPPNPDGGAPAPADDVFLVTLPIGPIAPVIYGVRDVEWLGTSGDLLATLSPGNELAVVPIDGSGSRVIARDACAHAATPDGSRVFVVRDCTSAGTGRSTRSTSPAASRRRARRWWRGMAAWRSRPAAASRRTSRRTRLTAAAVAACCTFSTETAIRRSWRGRPRTRPAGSPTSACCS